MLRNLQLNGQSLCYIVIIYYICYVVLFLLDKEVRFLPTGFLIVFVRCFLRLLMYISHCVFSLYSVLVCWEMIGKKKGRKIKAKLKLLEFVSDLSSISLDFYKRWGGTIDLV